MSFDNMKQNITDSKREIQKLCEQGMLDKLEVAFRKQSINYEQLANLTANLNKKIIDWNK